MQLSVCKFCFNFHSRTIVLSPVFSVHNFEKLSSAYNFGRFVFKYIAQYFLYNNRYLGKKL